MIAVAEYTRLLGYPAGKALEGAVLDRAAEAIAWYEQHGGPRVYIRHSVVALTAGAEVEEAIAERWRDGRVDEAYFLDRLAAGVVEHLARFVGVGPGPAGWDIARHSELMALLGGGAPVELLPSGMLKPVHSMLAVVTGESSTCRSCRFRCDFRRTA